MPNEHTEATARSRLGGPQPIVVNTDGGRAAALLERLADIPAVVVHACCGADLAETVRRVLRDGHRRVTVAGGDGTIATAAGVLLGHDAELAIIPGGTLNHFARDHGIPLDPEAALELARDGEARPTDVARVNGWVFLNTSSVGAYVSLVHIREGMERSLGYTMASVVAAVRVFVTLRRFVVEVTGPDGPQLFRTPLLFIGVGERELKLPMLGSRVEQGARGLHVMVVRGRTRAALVALAFAAATRGVDAVTPHLEAWLLDRCSVRLRRATRVATDGEVVQLGRSLEYEHLPGAIRLVRP